MGLEMADAACSVSLRAHRYNACSMCRVMLSLGKRRSGGAALCGGVVVAWGTAVEWEGARDSAGGSSTPPGDLLRSVPALRQLLEFAGEQCGSAGFGAGSSGAGQSCTWLGHADSSPGILLEDPAQLWFVGEAASPALCWAAARHGNGIWCVLSRTVRLAGQSSGGWGGTSFPQHGQSVWHALCCVAVEGDCQDSLWDPFSQHVAVQDQLACLPHLLTSMPWGCPGSQALVCRHPALEQVSGMRMVSAS